MNRSHNDKSEIVPSLLQMLEGNISEEQLAQLNKNLAQDQQAIEYHIEYLFLCPALRKHCKRNLSGISQAVLS
jgi:hypothetical protein